MSEILDLEVDAEVLDQRPPLHMGVAGHCAECVHDISLHNLHQ